MPCRLGYISSMAKDPGKKIATKKIYFIVQIKTKCYKTYNRI